VRGQRPRGLTPCRSTLPAAGLRAPDSRQHREKVALPASARTSHRSIQRREAVLDGVLRQLGDGAQIELIHQLPAEGVHSLVADA